MADDDMSGMSLDPTRHLNEDGMREFIMYLMRKSGKPANEQESKEADEEREKLADLHEEHKGQSSKIPVTEEDLPFVSNGKKSKKKRST